MQRLSFDVKRVVRFKREALLNLNIDPFQVVPILLSSSHTLKNVEMIKSY